MPSNWEVQAIRQAFPILHQQVNGHPLVYFDNAATTQKPQCVIDQISQYYQHDHANVHRGVHTLSVRATQQYEAARQQVASFIHAPAVRECIFVRGTTEGINLVAEAYVLPQVSKGDEILITHLEHHSNIVPWQRVCERTGARLVVAPITKQGELDLDAFAKCLSEKTRFVAMTYASNAIGTVNPVKDLIKMAHAVGAKVLIDGAQAVAHLPIDVQALGCDFFTFSGHKAFGPTGIGLLWGRAELLEHMSVYQTGGEMITRVSFERTEYAPIPAKFEAGTPDISGAIGLGRALQYLQSLDVSAMQTYESELLAYATRSLRSLGAFQIVGEAKEKVPVLAFSHPHIHAHDIGTVLDHEGIAIRSGHHCAMPLMQFYGVPALSRLSFSFYNTQEEVDRCMQVLSKMEALFS